MTEPAKALRGCLSNIDAYLDSDSLRDSVSLLSRTLMEPEAGDNEYSRESTVRDERRGSRKRGVWESS